MKYIAYLRRSKKEQESTLGLDAQRKSVYNYLQTQKDAELLNTYVELESGTRSKLGKRSIIYRAIDDCKSSGAILVIAKLDRLARDVEFIAGLMNSGVKFVACDIPQANEFTVHLMAAIAEQEAKRIGERTKEALAAKAKRGELLGWHTHKKPFSKLTNEARYKGSKVMSEKAKNNPNNQRARGYAQSLYNNGLSIIKIAAKMNEEGFTSPNGSKIFGNTVKRWLV